MKKTFTLKEMKKMFFDFMQAQYANDPSWPPSSVDIIAEMAWKRFLAMQKSKKS